MEPGRHRSTASVAEFGTGFCRRPLFTHARPHPSLPLHCTLQALCINDSVLRLQSPALISERCLDMQKAGGGGGSGGSKKAAVAGAPTSGGAGPTLVQPATRGGKGRVSGGGGRCAFLGSGSAAAATTRDMILAQPIDIEELAALGGWVGWLL